MLSQTAEYALRAVLYLHEEASEAPVRVDDVAEALDVPRNYLSKILHVLAREKLLDSTRGPHGGFMLSRSGTEIHLEEVVSCFDSGLMDPGERCLLGRAECSDHDPCAAHHRWKEVSSQVWDFFQNTVVADLAARDRKSDSSRKERAS